jgi:threonyl-tRNA synthetase
MTSPICWPKQCNGSFLAPDAFGPATDDGFYDLAPAPDRGPFTDEELPVIEEMRRIIDEDLPLVRKCGSVRMSALFEKQGERFKAEWVMELPEGEPITMYRSGNAENAWIDLCRGPHLASTGKLDPQAFKLTHVSGAYWRGDQNNPMLSRIYGPAWLNRKPLQEHLVRLEEAAKRDHRTIGKEMDLFHLQAEAHGSVFWHPNGFIIWRQLEAYMRRKLDAAGYVEIKTPQLMDAKQWEKSGHWGKYRENMFVVPDEIPSTDDDAPVLSGDSDLMALKPMNCRPLWSSSRYHQLQGTADPLCRNRPLPPTNRTGAAWHHAGRQFTQDDAHISAAKTGVIDGAALL